MKLLIITHTYGITSSGKATFEVVNALAEQGVLVDVICSRSIPIQASSRVNVYEIKQLLSRPSRLFKFLGNLIGRDLNYLFWRVSVIRFYKKFLGETGYDFVYGRGSPVGALLAAGDLAKIGKIPLGLHFADPIPATKEWQSNKKERKKLINEVSNVIKMSSLVTFVTQEMLEYQFRILDLKEFPTTLLLPNPIPEYISLNRDMKSRSVGLSIGFIGQLGSVRNPLPLIEAVNRLNVEGNKIDLLFVGTRRTDILKRIQQTSRYFIKFISYQNDLAETLNNLDMLVDIDSDNDEQVFISNKLMEYLATDKAILSISTDNSPSRRLTVSLNELFYRAHNNSNSIIKAINKYMLDEQTQNAAVSKERNILRGELSKENIAHSLVKALGSV
ncbi:hypothetical protein ACQ661_05285 [Pseudidiomarina sp. WS423]|uniref:hypothetical protein n=1 Tax=Pseudidiomarina sp. WS423 TaxID=3425124 RepID=UPI003D6EA9E9